MTTAPALEILRFLGESGRRPPWVRIVRAAPCGVRSHVDDTTHDLLQ